MQSAADYRLVYVEVAVPDLDIVAAIGACAYPRFVVNRRALTSKIRQRHQVASLTFLTFRKLNLFHGEPPPT